MSRSFPLWEIRSANLLFPDNRTATDKKLPPKAVFYLFSLSRKTLSQQLQFCSCQFQAPFFCSKKIQFFSFCKSFDPALPGSLPLTLYHALPDTQVPAVPVPWYISLLFHCDAVPDVLQYHLSTGIETSVPAFQNICIVSCSCIPAQFFCFFSCRFC